MKRLDWFTWLDVVVVIWWLGIPVLIGLVLAGAPLPFIAAVAGFEGAASIGCLRWTKAVWFGDLKHYR